ncbi:MAG: ATP-binding protein [Bacteroidales bacterium]|nr:ATP-binding protein [Bacteroidales bacterium]
MLKRRIAERIKMHLASNNNKILIVDGARQVGKSFIIRMVGKELFPNFVEINMYDDKKGSKAFEGTGSVADFYFRLSTVAGSKLKKKNNTLVFIDEIQVYPELLTLLKFLKDDDRYTYIVSGSQLGIALNETLSKPGGRIEIIRMYPLDFEEFLWANGVGEEAINQLEQSFNAKHGLDETMHRVFLDLFKKYLLVGGLPDAVNKFIETNNIVEVRRVHDGIQKLYREDAAQYDAENKLKIRRVYDLIPSNLENRKKRVQFNQIENKKGKTYATYADEFEYLIQAGVAIEVKSISNPRFPLLESTIKNLIKLYLNDVGLLTNLLYKYNIRAVLDDERSVNLGSVYESVVASELLAHGFDLYYYDNKSKGEVDFLIDDFDILSAVPLEVKSGKDYSIHKALDKFIANPDYNIKRAVVLSNEREFREEGRTLYVPIYFVMFFRPSTPMEISL